MKNRIETTSASLHIMAMAFMLCDHLWATVVPGNEWLTCVGRLAFPIFAFLIVEGYFHTSDLKKYALRLLVFAALSEIPFNLAAGGSVLYPFHQNVLWTFLISLGLIHWNESVKRHGRAVRMTVACVSVLLGSVAGLVAFADYLHGGVLTVLVFYFFRARNWVSRFCQLIGLAWINLELLGGLVYEFTVITFPQQGFALLALIPIWLYRGNPGLRSPVLKWINYLFYPVHLLILGLLMLL
ncbi:MAG: conjugal transfer protein TraX [Oscillospiraceae bacterium]|nr:conjugal transfer protein TraX [Oscillospiraceae bacterium]